MVFRETFLAVGKKIHVEKICHGETYSISVFDEGKNIQLLVQSFSPAVQCPPGVSDFLPPLLLRATILAPSQVLPALGGGAWLHPQLTSLHPGSPHITPTHHTSPQPTPPHLTTSNSTSSDLTPFHLCRCPWPSVAHRCW